MTIDFDIFRPANLENWEASLKIFHKELEIIEDDAKLVIDQCISGLRSTQSGIKQLWYNHGAPTRQCLIEHIQSKHNEIIKKYIDDLDSVDRQFQVTISYYM